MNNSIKVIREKNGMKQKILAEALGISIDTLWRWENGKGNPRWDDIKIMCSLFHCSADQLMSPPGKHEAREDYIASAITPSVHEITAEIAEFRDAINDLFPELADRDAYADILLDLKDNGRIDAPEMRAKIERGIRALEASLV